MRVCILGKSEVFISIIQDIHPNDKIEIVGWRSDLKITSFFDVIYVCGFDKSIYLKEFRSAILTGYLRQCIYISKLKNINPRIKIFYVNTNTKTKTVVSRYDFLKHRLENKLTKLGGYYGIAPDFIINKNGLPTADYGIAYNFTVCILTRLRILKVTEVLTLRHMLMEAKFVTKQASEYNYCLINFPRPMIVDKIAKSCVMLLRI